VPTGLETVDAVKDLVMDVVDDNNKVCCLQFHPVSIMTIQGSKLLDNIVIWVQHGLG
ncbi:anthranilate synthase component II, partial [Francisella tularensis subsp. holarctica]|uniref:glutamine amidotransferase-related protein n=1 Tax=Francisella tularensis TaxID=263 RepID=UPI0023AE37B4|nr:anthranilate synthase component II [Francisella tularensis subsp. holarctica]